MTLANVWRAVCLIISLRAQRITHNEHHIVISTAWTIITGAASGMGEAAARLMHAAGHRLLLCDINEDRLAILASQLSAPGLSRTLAGDIAALDFADRLVAVLENVPIAALVHCAGFGANDG